MLASSKERDIIDLGLCKTCPKGYPWVCSACRVKTEAWCPGRKKARERRIGVSK